MLPVGMLIAFIAMRLLGMNSNLMSLGGIAIAIGAMVDAAIVMIENAHKHLERLPEGHRPRPNDGDAGRLQGSGAGPVLLAAHHHRPFLPVFTLEGQEGRLFRRWPSPRPSPWPARRFCR